MANEREWPDFSTEELLDLAANEVVRLDEEDGNLDCIKHYRIGQLDYLEAIAQALVEIRDELRRLNNGNT